MKEVWELNLKNDVENLLNILRDKSNKFKFSPTTTGATELGNELTLGFSCYALKCHYMTGFWEKLDNKTQTEWSNYINSFQQNQDGLPNNSYIDDTLLNFYSTKINNYSVKNSIKKILKFLKISDRRTSEDYFIDSVRAESKQAISTLYQVGFSNDKKYNDFPKTESSINTYLNSLNWNKPWNAGAQYSALCVFTSTQLETNQKEKNEIILYNFLDKVLNSKTGFYHTNSTINQNEKINGAMKVITGLDWINKPIHKPEQIIDFCLSISPESEGCDIVDLVYVLYRACSQSNYKKSEVINYLNSLKKIIKANYHNGLGFSYYKDKSQVEYYGMHITKGLNYPDIHGTTLLLWALTMIYSIQGSSEFNVIKP